MNKILIVEDEEKVSNIQKAYLEKEGYEVHTSTTGLKALELFDSIEFNLVILDLMLPDIQGEEICKIIRDKSDVHIFMATAKSALEDRIEGLNTGADEYLVKPFSPRELVARVNSLFRRLGSKDSSVLSLDDGNIQIYKDSRIVKARGQEISLTPNEFDILYALAINKGKVLSREQLIDRVFGMDFEGFDRTVDVHIKNIRKKIEEDSKNPKYILTVTRLGYKFGGDN
ncbi:response regulator transcription factor [Clostridium magnum]|uniref:Stage 0 sporulation protein A homolog n=1 Tax=Clostridium magnum DSM 2767 TaxID=1121326 RepID=A0A161XET5_9CLOT|nr:response regulator transcription factor [Clostridium magnum]KZL92956.1 sensory transduction protein regX3 [Clostridium magnum DSM 2767]SHJ21064.1 DNA-binding response regulator, OmpR family, contains REC and winged-helix (wHTH) domain [Clostridium magnum DSM 2767]